MNVEYNINGSVGIRGVQLKSQNLNTGTADSAEPV